MNAMRTKTLYLLLCSLLIVESGHAEDAIRVGALRFGTVNWQLNVIQHHQLDEKNNFKLTIVPLASKNAAAVALQGKSADVIVGDWFWVTRQNNRGKNYLFAPYSQAAGGILLAHDSKLNDIANLTGKKIGVAGGKIDKSWLITRAFIIHSQQRDPTLDNDIIYGAPPLLSQLLKRGELDAILTFWHYQARLRFTGHKQLISVPTMIESLGIHHPIPINGWIFSEEFSQKNPHLISSFLQASAQANDIMKNSDSEWERLATIMPPQDQPALQQFKQGYRDGIPAGDPQSNIKAMQQLFSILYQWGGKDLVGDAKELDPSIFWYHNRLTKTP